MKTVRIVEFDASGIRTGVVDVDPGKTHTVTWVWAWNRTLRFEQDRDTDSAQAILTKCSAPAFVRGRKLVADRSKKL
jgi:hypothetical protein